MLQLLWCCFQELQLFNRAHDIGSQVIQLYRPFRLRSVEYLTWMVKNDPAKMLGDEGIQFHAEYFAELCEVSGIMNGGDANILFEQYRLDFGMKGF
mmetsp:Transcript_25760/g.58314  ORF Transcript_25760/g.58314 Transcript_25760/m.58314 type:complete len:96 (+) Transcript_25760:3-290(+)